MMHGRARQEMAQRLPIPASRGSVAGLHLGQTQLSAVRKALRIERYLSDLEVLAVIQMRLTK